MSSGMGALPERMGSRKNSAMITSTMIATIFTFLFHLLLLLSLHYATLQDKASPLRNSFVLMCNKSYLLYLIYRAAREFSLAAVIASVVIGGFTGDE